MSALHKSSTGCCKSSIDSETTPTRPLPSKQRIIKQINFKDTEMFHPLVVDKMQFFSYAIKVISTIKTILISTFLTFHFIFWCSSSNYQKHQTITTSDMEGHEDRLEDIRRTSEASETINTIPEKGKFTSTDISLYLNAVIKFSNEWTIKWVGCYMYNIYIIHNTYLFIWSKRTVVSFW